MHRLMLILILTFLSSAALCLPTAITTVAFTTTAASTSLGKRAPNLPNGWYFILKAKPALLQPTETSVLAVTSIYTSAINRARKVPPPLDAAVTFMIGRHLLLSFREQAEDGRALDWATVEEFCKKMWVEAYLGVPIVFEGWLLNRETGGQIHVELGVIE
ncbi:MAG: hypothetical protein Q9188_004592 [Gyalolechia gomerana]